MTKIKMKRSWFKITGHACFFWWNAALLFSSVQLQSYSSRKHDVMLGITSEVIGQLNLLGRFLTPLLNSLNWCWAQVLTMDVQWGRGRAAQGICPRIVNP